MAQYSITIPGEPVGKARPRVTGKGFAYTPKTTGNYETLIKELFFHKHGSLMLKGNIHATLKAYFGLNKDDYGKTGLNKQGRQKLGGALRPTKKPDIDNIAKIVLDGLNGVAYMDDSQVVALSVEKRYAQTPCVEIVPEALDGTN